jgi:hypothetical protein
MVVVSDSPVSSAKQSTTNTANNTTNPIDDFGKELQQCPDNDSQRILNCLRVWIIGINAQTKRIKKQANALIAKENEKKKIMIRMAAERIKQAKQPPSTICAILTKELDGLVSARTIRNALGPEFKSIRHSNNAKKQTPHHSGWGHNRKKEDEANDAATVASRTDSVAALMPQKQKQSQKPLVSSRSYLTTLPTNAEQQIAIHNQQQQQQKVESKSGYIIITTTKQSPPTSPMQLILPTTSISGSTSTITTKISGQTYFLQTSDAIAQTERRSATTAAVENS